MSRVCGFKITSNDLFIVTLEGTRSAPVLVAKDSIRLPPNQTPGQFANWAETQLGLILEQEKPDLIIYKLTTPLFKHDQIFRIYFGIAILNLLAYRLRIDIRHLTPTQRQPTAFGLLKSDKVDRYIREFFGGQDSPWNFNVREAASIALLGLD